MSRRDDLRALKKRVRSTRRWTLLVLSIDLMLAASLLGHYALNGFAP